jgi:ABC-type transport system involved in multi-copper enzyme maturation permease subunit
MKTSFFTIYKIEVIKLIKRKDWLALMALVGISILFGAAVISNGYKGISNQSALFWIYTQAFNSSALCFTPLVFAFVASRILASEIENGSILLYTNRYRNRGRLYLAKSLALTSFTAITFLAMCLVNMAVYYILVVQNPAIASGQFFGENTAMLFWGLFTLYLSSFILASQLSLFLSVFCKPTPIIGIMFVVVLVLHNTFKIPLLYNLNPWYYVVRIGNDIAATTKKVTVNYSEVSSLLIAFVLLTAICVILFNLLGKRKFQKMDL